MNLTNENPKRIERRAFFAEKNLRRREARRQGRTVVLANREMGRQLADRCYRKDYEPRPR